MKVEVEDIAKIQEKIEILEHYEKDLNLNPYVKSIDNLYETFNNPSKKDKLLLRIATFGDYKKIKSLKKEKSNRKEAFRAIAIEAAKNFIKAFPYLPHKNLTLKKNFGIPSNNHKNQQKFKIKKYTLEAIQEDKNQGIVELEKLEEIIKKYNKAKNIATIKLLDTITLAKEKYFLNYYLRQKGNHTQNELQQAVTILKRYFPNTIPKIPTKEDLQDINRTPDILLLKDDKTIFVELKVWNELTPNQDLKLMEQLFSYAFLSKGCILIINLKDQNLSSYIGEYTIKAFTKKIWKRIEELKEEKERILIKEREQQRQASKQILKTWINEDNTIETEIELIIMEMLLITIIHGVANEELGIIQNQLTNGYKLIKNIQKHTKPKEKIRILRINGETNIQELINENTYLIGIIEESIEEKEIVNEHLKAI